LVVQDVLADDGRRQENAGGAPDGFLADRASFAQDTRPMKQAIDEGFILKLSDVVIFNGADRVASPSNTQRDSSCKERDSC
jgi:hypothetical protein